MLSQMLRFIYMERKNLNFIKQLMDIHNKPFKTPYIFSNSISHVIKTFLSSVLLINNFWNKYFATFILLSSPPTFSY